ncbi:MAG: (Fe-S)-binding protein [Bryobacterales bacterium]|nr:(Fe-S)-binding protein [Bryobacterales bacterium]
MSTRVSIFVTCLVDQLFPKTGLAMATVLERLGYSIEFREDQTCCGQPAFNSGFRDEARTVARHFLKVFADADYVVLPSGSCTAMCSHHFSELFRDDPAALYQVHALEPRIWEFSRFLLEVAKVDDVGASFPGRVTYHDSCHALRELSIKQGPRTLLRKVRGLELVEMDTAEECCGFGGTFSAKFAELSGAMARTKVESIRRTGASAVVSIDSSCLMQIQGAMRREGLKVQALHLAEVLAGGAQ